MPQFTVAELSASSHWERQSKEYCRFLPVKVRGQTCGALIDSGNLWRPLISEKFAHLIGLSVQKGTINPLKAPPKLSTAKEGSELMVLGETAGPLTLKLSNGEVHEFWPAVIRGLTMPINISGPFLKENSWDQIHSENCLRINGRKVALTRHETAVNNVGRVYSVHKTHVRAGTYQSVIVTAPLVRSGQLPPADSYYEKIGDWDEQAQVLTPRCALVTPDREGVFRVCVVNPTDQDHVIRKGTLVGQLLQLTGDQHLLERNDHVAALAAPADDLQRALQQMKQQPASEPKAIDVEETRKRKEQAEQLQQMTARQKEAYLIQRFKLKEKVHLAKKEDLVRAARTLAKFWHVFAWDGSYGHTHLIQHRILTGDAAPVKCRYRPINPALEPALKEQLQDWLRHGVIEEADSPWSSNVVPVRKKSGLWRFCIDWRDVNAVSRGDSMRMPLVQTTIAKLAGSSVYSSIDMHGAFHAIDIHPDDREKTAFATPFGMYQQRRLGFGLTNGPATYCRLVNKVLEGIPESKVVAFLDDGVVHSPTVEEHFHNLELTLAAYDKAGLRLNPDKCSFFADKVVYLGHLVNRDGIRPTENYVKTVSEWQVPVYKTDARSFIGLANYYREHIPNFAMIAKPWSEVMGKKDVEAERTPLKVTPEMKVAFERLKKALISAPILGFPYVKGPKAGVFILDTDYSKDRIAAVLSQMQQGKETVIAYASKKNTSYQQNYASTKGELFAGSHFMRHFAYYLQCSPFIWRTDNAALQYVRKMEPRGPAIERWLNTLADFHFKVVHRAGKDHGNADALSRGGGPSLPEENGRQHELVLQLEADASGQVSRDGGSSGEEVSLRERLEPENLRELQNQDRVLAEVLQWIEKGSKPNNLDAKSLSLDERLYLDLYGHLEINKQGILCRRLPAYAGQLSLLVPCIPLSLQDEVIRLCHETGGHMARDATVNRLKRKVFFPRMTQEVESWISTCLPCQKKKAKPPDQKHTLVAPICGYPFQRLHIDFVGKLSPGRKTGAQWILTCRDSFSKWVEAFPLKTPDTRNVIDTLFKEVFSRFGFPEIIHSDQGTPFVSKLMLEMGKQFGIKMTNTTGWNPKSNSQIERMHRDLWPMLKAMIDKTGDPSSWEDLLPQALFAMRTSTCASTGLAPYQILFGRDCSAPIDVYFGNPPGENEAEGRTCQAYLRDLRERIRLAENYARANLRQAVIRQRRQYHHEKKTFKPGTKVWLFTPIAKPGVSRKLSVFWTGPWLVCNEPTQSETLLRIAPAPEWKDHKFQGTRVVSIDRLKLYKSSLIQEPDDSDDIERSHDEFAEQIPLFSNEQAPTGAGAGAGQPAMPWAGAPGAAPPPPPPPLAPPPAPPQPPPLPPRPPMGLMPPVTPRALTAAQRRLTPTPPAPSHKPAKAERPARKPKTLPQPDSSSSSELERSSSAPELLGFDEEGQDVLSQPTRAKRARMAFKDRMRKEGFVTLDTNSSSSDEMQNDPN